MSNVDPNGQWVIPVIVGGVAIAVAIIRLPDWDADSLSSAQAAQAAKLIAELKKCANTQEMGYLNSMTITGIFERGEPDGDDDVSETRNGRFFGWGNRTILSADFFQRDSVEAQLRTLLHESYHAGTEDWTENVSYSYADKALERMKCCLQKNGVLKELTLP